MASDTPQTEAAQSQMLQAMLQPWHDAVADPAKAQQEVLHRLLQIYAQTDYGKQHNASQVGSVGDYRRAFPIATYEDYKPLIDLLTLQPGLLACLKQLRSRYRTAIATSRTRTMNQVMAKFGLNTYFELVVTSLDVLHPKPHPESLNKILSHFHLTPQEACYIGDSDVDRKTSQSAGVLFIAYNNEELEAAHHLSHFDELIPFLNQYNQLRE